MNTIQMVIHIFESMKWQQPEGKIEPQYGQFLIAISNKENAVIKYINQNHQIKCQKIINIDCRQDQQYYQLFHHQLQRIKAYLFRRYNIKNELYMDSYLTIKVKKGVQQNQRFTTYKLNTKFWDYPTYQQFLRKQYDRNSSRSTLSHDPQTILYFIEQFLQIILRVGGIDYFFYTPKNIFVISPKVQKDIHRLDKLIVNYTSMVGIKLFLLNNKCKIYRQDFCQIYPLIPPNFYQLKEEKKFIQINNIIKKRSFAYLILCFIIKKIPNIIDNKTLDLLLTQHTIRSKIQQTSKIFQQILNLYSKQFQDAEEKTGIKLAQLIRSIFIEPYEKQYLSEMPTWNKIYKDIFKNSKWMLKQKKRLSNKYDIQNSQRYFEKMLLNLWRCESKESKRYFIQRQYAFPIGFSSNKQEAQLNQTIMYFITKFNCDLHNVLKYPNPCLLIMNERFSQSSNTLVMEMMKTFNQQAQQIQNKLISKQISEGQQDEEARGLSNINEEQLSSRISHDQKGEDDSLISIQQFNLFNPFLMKNSNDLKDINRQLRFQKSQQSKNNSQKLYFSNIKTAQQLLINTFSLRQKDKSSQIITLSHKQVTLNQFCGSLWKL